MHTEAPIVENKRTGYALCHIVGHTHLAVRYKQAENPAHLLRTIKTEKHSRHKHEHKGKISQRGHQQAQRPENIGILDKARQHIVKTVQREECHKSPRKHAPPAGQGRFQQPALAPYQHTEHKQPRCLENTPMVPRPRKTRQLPFPQIHLDGIPETATRLNGKSSLPVFARRYRRNHIRRVGNSSHYIVQRHRLKQTYRHKPQQHLVRQAAGSHKHKAYQRVHHQYLCCKEHSIEITYHEQQQQAPAETRAEVLAAHTLVIVLNKETESEQQRENGICLTAEQEEKAVPDSAVRKIQPRALPCRVRERIKIEMLYRMQQNNAHHSQAAQHIGHIHTLVRHRRPLHSVHIRGIDWYISAKIRISRAHKQIYFAERQ